MICDALRDGIGLLRGALAGQDKDDIRCTQGWDIGLLRGALAGQDKDDMRCTQGWMRLLRGALAGWDKPDMRCTKGWDMSIERCPDKFGWTIERCTLNISLM